MKRGFFVALAAGVLATMVYAPGAPAADGQCAAPQSVQAPPGGWSATRRPVVFVHGWTGGAMTEAAQKLRAKLGDRISTFTFDYNKFAAHWASEAPVAACLAAFVNAVAEKHRSRDIGGDGKVVVVAHSMGGLALRYATDATVVSKPVNPGVLSQVVTLGTPHLGAPLGGSWLAGRLEDYFLRDKSHVRPPADKSAARCLASHRDQAPLPDRCGPLPSYLLGGVNLTQIAGDITVDRKVFGHTLYSVPLNSDGTVPVPSARGYLESGKDKVAPVGGVRSRSVIDSCRVDFDQLKHAGDVANLVGPTEWFDYLTLRDLQRGEQTPRVLGLSFTAGLTASCGHSALPTEGSVLDEIGRVVDAVPPADPHEVRFDGVGSYSLRLTAKELTARGFTDVGNDYGSTDCVRYKNSGQEVTFSVEPRTGQVLAVNAGGDRRAHTRPGNIHAGSTLADVRSAFRGFTVEERLDLDFGQGSNGVIVSGPGGAIGLGLEDASSADYAAGRAKVDYIAGAGIPGHAPSRMEIGC